MEIKPRKKVVPAFVGYVTVIFIVALIVLFIVSLVQKNVYYILLPMIVFTVYYVVFNFGFSWYKSEKIQDKGKYIEFIVQDVVSILGKDETSYRISGVDKLVVRGHDLIVYGTISVKEPMMKPKDIKKCRIYDYTQEVKNLLESKK